jgi:hypothetical protein
VALAAHQPTEFEVWPENWPVWLLFDRISTQWRVGMNGPIGLDYNVLLRFLDRMRLDDGDYEQMLNDISVLEQSALTEIHAET